MEKDFIIQVLKCLKINISSFPRGLKKERVSLFILVVFGLGFIISKKKMPYLRKIKENIN